MDKQPITQSALIVVDVQDSFKRGTRWERRSTPDFEKNLTTLIDGYREAGLPVIFMIHSDNDPGFRPSDPEFKLMDFIQRRDSEPLIPKTTYNSFTSTDLQQRLDALGVKRIVITGIVTEQCCETTARVGCDLGFDVDFVTSATVTFPIVNPENGDVLTTDEVIRRTEFALRGRFARIATVDSLVAEIQKELQPSNR
jgi:nicotinamidase-related amidase